MHNILMNRTNFFSGREVDFGALASTEVQEVMSSPSTMVNASDHSTIAEQCRLLGRNTCIEMGTAFYSIHIIHILIYCIHWYHHHYLPSTYS